MEDLEKVDKIWLTITDKKFPPWRSYFLYFDTPQYLADSVFVEQKLEVKFEKNEYIKHGFPYIGVLCSVKRTDEHKFVAAMDMVKKKMLICGYTDYEKECINFLNGMMKAYREGLKMKFILNGCDISFIAEAPEDITLKQLIEQTDKIFPDWCACGICSLDRDGWKTEPKTEIYIDYDSVRKADDNVNCRIIETWRE